MEAMQDTNVTYVRWASIVVFYLSTRTYLHIISYIKHSFQSALRVCIIEAHCNRLFAKVVEKRLVGTMTTHIYRRIAEYPFMCFARMYRGHETESILLADIIQHHTSICTCEGSLETFLVTDKFGVREKKYTRISISR